jgi:hypothetical protein
MAVATRVKKWTIPQLVSMKREEFITLWKTLPAPDFKEMNGEYSGYCIDSRNPEIRKRLAEFMFNEASGFGYWLGKAYKPVSANKGEGYNHCRRLGGWVERHLRFGTEVATSLIDGKPSFMLYYGHFKNGSGARDLTDELRKLADGIYLGCGTTLLPDGKRSEPGPFIMAGPIHQWVGVDDEKAELK